MSMPAVIQLLAFVAAGGFVAILVALIVAEVRAQRSERRHRATFQQSTAHGCVDGIMREIIR